MYAEKEIISLCNTRYGHKLKGFAIKNIYDIVTLFTKTSIIKDDYMKRFWMCFICFNMEFFVVLSTLGQ